MSDAANLGEGTKGRTLAQVGLEDARDGVRIEVARVRKLEIDVGPGVKLGAELDDCEAGVISRGRRRAQPSD